MAKKHPIKERFERLIERVPESGCWLWVGNLFASGYGKLTGDNQVTLRAHRWSWEIHNGLIPMGMCVLHRCDVKSCVNPDHLFLGSIQDNHDDMWQKGRANPPKGERASAAKLTEPEVLQIRAERAAGVRGKALAKRFNVSEAVISNIVHKKIWKHLLKKDLP